MSDELLYRDEVYAIQGAIFDVYSELGNGYREEVYQQCLELELAKRKIPFEAKIDNYLRLTHCHLGLLVNFGSFPKATIKRWAR